ncbi:DEAD/DEAH box helicase [Flavicella sp.]|uniref:DEAD/DEAH box helicase n=1 Tax=Flavicella sp. TaxID=2957742 RepID=UPI00262D34C4|nr:DEAD/DEAH box helicase [Flavicella sp.]MDG1803727.1 DEAD/DEAH box helicase [Flavicella sp.]MDG2279155.1 DEAD/DEAH box helicase [Flavicella sp.]
MTTSTSKKNTGKELYDYQKEALSQIFGKIEDNPESYNLVYQLPTGGGKTVIFSEIARRYIEETGKKVLILTHRIELCNQTSRMLTEFDVKNKIINSNVKELHDQDEYMCFVAMVETLKNRLNDDKLELDQIGLVIIDEAHYNSFRKLFKYFENCFILGVTATPLSSNMKLPMNEIYNELLVGEPVQSLVDRGFLAKATTYTYDVALGTLKVGINGDYTVKSSEELYSNNLMQEKLLYAYEEKSLGKKTLIFNNGINTSLHVYETFKAEGYDVMHLDNTNSKQEREFILKWFKETPNAILTSVGILTTGFDEPSVETIILNRATKSITLYYQMIGRGSRVIGDKKDFTVLDLGNNAARFGLWGTPLDWRKIFSSPLYYLDNLIGDEDIERNFTYTMPPEIRAEFPNSTDFYFNVKEEYDKAIKMNIKSKIVLDKSIEQHCKLCVENSEDVFDARILSRLLQDDISDRIKKYSYCIIKSTKNYIQWLEDDYKRRLSTMINQSFS